MQSAVDGTLNVLHQSEKAGITKIVYCSSIVTAFNHRGTYGNDGLFSVHGSPPW